MKIITKTALVASLSIAAVFGSSVVLAHSANGMKASEFKPVQNTKISDRPILGEQACEDYPLC